MGTKFSKFFKIIVLILVLTIIASSMTYANTNPASESEGYRVNHGTAMAVSFSRACYRLTNSHTNDYFIPTKSSGEWTAFSTHLPGKVSVASCPSPTSPCTQTETSCGTPGNCVDCTINSIDHPDNRQYYCQANQIWYKAKVCDARDNTCKWQTDITGDITFGGGSGTVGTPAPGCTPTNGGWSTFYSGDCAACGASDCGYKTGFKAFSRSCNNPVPSCGGQDCSYGEDYYTEYCAEYCGQDCPGQGVACQDVTTICRGSDALCSDSTTRPGTRNCGGTGGGTTTCTPISSSKCPSDAFTQSCSDGTTTWTQSGSGTKTCGANEVCSNGACHTSANPCVCSSQSSQPCGSNNYADSCGNNVCSGQSCPFAEIGGVMQNQYCCSGSCRPYGC